MHIHERIPQIRQVKRSGLRSFETYVYSGEQSRLIPSRCPDPETVSDRYNAPLEYLQPTAAGIDGLPAWFLRVAAPIFCKTIAYLINTSLATSTIPRQWTEAKMRPLYLKYQTNLVAPKQHADYHPTPITPIRPMSRLMVRTVARTFICPTFLVVTPY